MTLPLRNLETILIPDPQSVISEIFDFPQTRTNIINIVQKEINRLNINKIGTFNNISPKLLKEVSEISSPILSQISINEIITSKHFSENLELPDVKSVHKKEGPTLVKDIIL